MSTALTCLALAALLAVVLFTATWLVSRRIDNYSLVDIAWAYAFAFVAALFAALGDGFLPRRLAMLVLAGTWSLRLGSHLFQRIRHHHPREDIRYAALRQKWAAHPPRSFFLFFQMQALSVVLLAVPFLLASVNPAPDFSVWEFAGAAVWLTGMAGEAIADRQLRRFKLDPANRGRVCNAGLWRCSRHPNYFFESLVWWGFWLFACGSPHGWLTLYAPLGMLWLLLRVTGIPLTERCAVESKGDAYREYQRTTSAFVPWFPKA